MQKLLIFLGGYFPSYGAPGIVIEKLLPSLKQRFDITILTVRRKKHDFGKSFEYGGVAVYEVSDWIQDRCVESHGVAYLFWRCVQEMQKLLVRQPLFVYNLGNTVALADRLHAEKRFDSVLSVSFPPYAHIAAQRFVSLHPELRWVAYSTDTLFDHEILKSKWLGWQLKPILKKEMAAYRKATHVFVTPEIYAWADRMFKNGEVRPKKLEYTLSLDAVIRGDNMVFAADSLHIVYAGVFYEKTRDPRWFLAVVKKILEQAKKKLCFHFFLASDVYKAEISELSGEFPENVILHPAVQPAEVKHIMNAADILLNFSNDADQFSPSKLFDYFATGRPILNVAYPNRNINPVLRRYPLALTLVNDGDVTDGALQCMAYIKSVEGRRIPVDQIQSMFPEYLVENVAQQIAGALA